MENNNLMTKEKCEQKHLELSQVVKNLVQISERLDKIICGSYDDNGRKISGLVDIVNSNTDNIKKIFSIKHYIVNFMFTIIGAVISGTIVYFTTHPITTIGG